jgi:transcriptional regulator with XRE-family HTH domain
VGLDRRGPRTGSRGQSPISGASSVQPSDEGGFGALLKLIRAEQRVSQLGLARKVKCSQSYISQIESGSRHPPAPSFVAMLCDALSLGRAETSRLYEAAGYVGPWAREAEQDWEHRPLHLRQRLLRAVVGAVGTSPLSRHEQVMLSDVIERLQMWELLEQASSAIRGDPRIASAMCQRILATDQRSPLLQLTAQVQSELRLRIGVSPDAT